MDLNKLKNLIEVEKLPQWKVAEILGCSQSCIERNCKRHQLKTQRSGPRAGELHPDWKGGRVVVGGYVYVYNANHPNHTKRNYVAEHRLVMENKLGRYLLKSEVVHHINGIRDDNRPENLAMFSTNAEHLKYELTGRLPNWTQEGKERIAKGIERSCMTRRKSKSGD